MPKKDVKNPILFSDLRKTLILNEAKVERFHKEKLSEVIDLIDQFEFPLEISDKFEQFMTEIKENHEPVNLEKYAKMDISNKFTIASEDGQFNIAKEGQKWKVASEY